MSTSDDAAGAAPASRRQVTEIRTDLNLALSGGFLASGVALILLLPALADRQPVWGLLWIPFVIVTPTLWALIHEAIHGSLHPVRRWNDGLGRALGILFGSPLAILRLGHLVHHRVYGLPDEAQPARARPRILAVPLHYLRLAGGLYLLEVAAIVLALLPRPTLRWIARQAARRHPLGERALLDQTERGLLTTPILTRLRVDALLIVVLYGTGLLFYGAQVWMLLAAVAGRGALVSFMDNIYHHSPAGDPRRTMDLTLPGWASGAILHANLHAVHHRRPDIPWSGLPLAGARYPDMPRRPFAAIAWEQLARPTA
ncbi:fatty acid desaturase [Thiococcus pfennigii]|uniref:fatty acid desaturase n=1 Tax=Thiococcus pfennigii TaxID=1057 RepID=UPI0019052372|nr:fatty acid desaturase [Thiococcus pfennigii]MBK1702211.1 hypothetical protein [Thiococcus pfennigii]